jgi:hypothetical protein
MPEHSVSPDDLNPELVEAAYLGAGDTDRHGTARIIAAAVTWLLNDTDSLERAAEAWDHALDGQDAKWARLALREAFSPASGDNE